MKHTRKIVIRAILMLGTAVAWTLVSRAQSHEPISPIPLQASQDLVKVALGRDLFNDPRLSKGNALACAHCHNVAAGGADKVSHSIGLEGRLSKRNTPTILNVSLNFVQGWDGRSNDLESQTTAVLMDPAVMGSSWKEVVDKLATDTPMAARFRAAYADGLQVRNLQDAMVAYERSLTTPNSRFDRYLRGEAHSLSSDEIKGYELFKTSGCIACHQGTNIGGNVYQVFGVMGGRGSYFRDRGGVTEADFGRFNRTHAEEDRFVFRVPSLRNVALTAPYFHDGSAPTLDDAVSVMFKYQLGRTASPAEKALIVTFLRSLTGELDGKPLEPKAAP
jgi:cytochrome c peroxidase